MAKKRKKVGSFKAKAKDDAAILRKVRNKKLKVANASAYTEPSGKKAGKNSPPAKFKKGNPGRAKGATDRVPRSIRRTMKDIIEDVVANESKTLKDALIGGIKGGPAHADRYIKLVTEHNIGKPVDTINMNQSFNDTELSSAKVALGRQLDRMFLLLVTPADDTTESKTDDAS